MNNCFGWAEMGLLAQERDAAKAQFDQGAQFVQAMTAKTQQASSAQATPRAISDPHCTDD